LIDSVKLDLLLFCYMSTVMCYVSLTLKAHITYKPKYNFGYVQHLHKTG